MKTDVLAVSARLRILYNHAQSLTRSFNERREAPDNPQGLGRMGRKPPRYREQAARSARNSGRAEIMSLYSTYRSMTRT